MEEMKKIEIPGYIKRGDYVKCPLCDKPIGGKSGLISHLRHKHNIQKERIKESEKIDGEIEGVDYVKCPECNKIFRGHSTFSNHIRKIHNEDPKWFKYYHKIKNLVPKKFR